MQPVDAFAAVRQGEALAFLGAGFPLGAMNAEGVLLPKGTELAARLMKGAGVDDEADYGLAADLFQKLNPANPTALTTFLEKQFSVASITDAHRRFAAFRWRRIYTTNYDNVAELASSQSGISRTSVTTRSAPEEYSRAMPWIVHLHGYVGNLKGRSFVDPLVLSRTSYLDMELPKTQWPTLLQSDATAARAVFIVGYSLADLHIAKLLHRVATHKAKTFVVTQIDPPAALKSYASEFGTVLPIGLDGLVDAIEKAEVLPAGLVNSRRLVSFQPMPLPSIPKEPTSDDVQKLLIGGVFRPEMYLKSLLDDARPYTFHRSKAFAAINRWSGSPRKFIVSSRIGNGKTTFLSQAAVYLAREQHKVFRGLHAAEGYHGEIEQIRKESGPFVFLYDGAREHEEVIKAVSRSLEARDILIVTARSNAFASDEDGSSIHLGDDFVRIDLDHLDPREIGELDRVWAFYGLWGAVAGNTQASRFKFVKDDCGSEARAVVLHSFRSSSVSDRIRVPVQKLVEQKPHHAEALAALLVIRLADCKLDFTDLCEMFGIEQADIRRSFQSSGVSDFFPDDDVVEFQARSPILAEHVLSTLLPGALCLNALTRLVTQLVDFREADWRYEEAIPSILRFAVVTRIFRDKDRRSLVISLYERILDISFLREDPQFWLQFAMARMEDEDWLSAEKCLETAYQKARTKRNYRTYKLDNQKIRFLLLATVAGYLPDCSKSALEACNLINQRVTEMRRDIDVYAYRNVPPLIRFQTAFARVLNAAATSAVIQCMETLLERLRRARRSRTLSDEEERYFKALSKA